MKKNILWISSLVVVSVFMSGCGASKSQQTAQTSINKQQAKSKARINMQQSGPNIKALEKYALSERSKYFYKLLSQHNQNPDLIPTVYMDPKTNKEAEEKNASDFAIVKASIIKMGKRNRMSKSVIANFIKTIKKDFFKPFYKMVDLPKGIDEGTIRIEAGNDSVVESKNLTMLFTYDDEKSKIQVFDSLVKDFDEFFAYDLGWKKNVKFTEELTEDAIELMLSLNKAYKQRLVELGNSKSYDAIRDSIESNIVRTENQIKSFRKTLKRSNKQKYQEKQVIFQYNWTKTGSSAMNMYAIRITEIAGKISVSYIKLLRK